MQYLHDLNRFLCGQHTAAQHSHLPLKHLLQHRNPIGIGANADQIVRVVQAVGTTVQSNRMINHRQTPLQECHTITQLQVDLFAR